MEPLCGEDQCNKQADGVFWRNCITFHVANMVKSLREIGYDKWVFALSNDAGADMLKITGQDLARNSSLGLHARIQDNPPELQALIEGARRSTGECPSLF